jgi:hypothetical protein
MGCIPQEMCKMATRTRMDRVKFDATTEIVARILKQKADEVIETKKVMLNGGLMKFDTERLINDLEQVIEELKMYAPEGFVETFPKAQDSGQPSTDE